MQYHDGYVDHAGMTNLPVGYETFYSTAAGGAVTAVKEAPRPTNTENRSGNPMRPTTFDEMIGQPRTKNLMSRLVAAAYDDVRPLDHVLLLGASGTGKTTLANIIGNAMQTDVYMVEAPVTHDLLLQLREVMCDGDILFVDEIHRQMAPDRRGVASDTQPENFFHLMEDRKLLSGNQVLDFPEITVIGATTDAGLLPEPFLNRFPLQPVLEPYTVAELTVMAEHNADALDLAIVAQAADLFASAARGVPRLVNSYVKNARSLCTTGVIDYGLAKEIVNDLAGTTDDGLNRDMQKMLTFLLTRCKRESPSQGVTYQASVGSLATALGKSRDQKAIALYVEPYLIAEGYIQVGHGGRRLTPAGVKRAKELTR